MADVTHEDRGQLILITGFALAVVLLTLVLLLNSAIFVEHTATQRPSADAAAPIEFRDGTITATERTIGAVNEPPGTNESTAMATFDTLANRTYDRYARKGAIANVSYEVTAGTVIEKTNTSANTQNGSPSGPANWTVLDNASETRAYTHTFTRLNETTDPVGNATAIVVNGRTLYVSVEGTSGSVRDLTSGDTVLVTEEGGDTCSIELVDHNTVTFDITAAELRSSNARCSIETVSAGDSIQDVAITRGDLSNGSYTLVTRGGTTESGTQREGVYSVIVSMRYVGESVTVDTAERVAPGEPHA
ncbi:DUF7261 family protein [Halalkalirubrum salinum]|uniref:DUF7261 family protein n=1 Tax=Halalkalirubrum salinum TaxID=2563889 RepID=UPI0010FADB1D|nr:hypothetical protein [Halalkalirubrum salinum]